MHFVRTALVLMLKGMQALVASTIRMVFAQPDAATACEQWRRVVDGFRERSLMGPRRHGKLGRAAGRGRSKMLSPEAIGRLQERHRAGESIRALARATGVSHETMRRAFQESRRSMSA